MQELANRGVSPESAAALRRLARRWLIAVAFAGAGAILVRLAFGGTALHDWESTVWPAMFAVYVLGIALAVRREAVAAACLGFLAVTGGVALSLHFSPWIGAIPVVAVLPAVVMFVLAWQRVRSTPAVSAFLAGVVVILAAGAYSAFAVHDAVFGPTHPESDSAAPAESPVVWMWAGAVETDRFAVVAGLDRPDRATLLVSAGTDGPWQSTATAVAGADAVVRFEASGLVAGQSYAYVVETTRGRGPIGHLATFPDIASDITIAFSSCARSGSNGAVFDAIRATDPDVYVISGDLFYGDIGPDDRSAFAASYRTALTQPAQAALYRSVPIAYVWDDHDYGRNDADSTAPSRPAAMQAYRDFVPHYPLATHDSPIYQGFTIGRVRVLITDTRSGRRPADATMLGAEQLGWLKAQLTAAASRFPLVIWVNPDPWIAADDPTADHWGGFEAERTEIAELIGRLELDGLLMLSGDAHMVAIDDGTNNVYAEGARFPVFHAGALDRPGSVKGGPYSAGAYPGGGQFGVVTIRDDGASITVELSGRDWTGEELVHHTFTVPGGDD